MALTSRLARIEQAIEQHEVEQVVQQRGCDEQAARVFVRGQRLFRELGGGRVDLTPALHYIARELALDGEELIAETRLAVASVGCLVAEAPGVVVQE